MQNSRTSNVVKNSGANILHKLVQIIVQFALRTVIIQILGREYAGISTLFTDILQVLSLLDLGMGTALAYALYKPVAEDNTDRINALMNFYRRAYMLIGTLVFGIGILLVPFLDYLVKDVPNIREDIRIIYAAYVLTSAMSYFFVYRTIIFRARQEARVISLVRTVITVIEGVFEIVFLIITKQFYVYLFLHFVFTFGTNAVLSYIAGHRHDRYFNNKKAELAPQEVRSMFKDISALAIYKISGVVIYSTDSIVISAFISTQQVAVIGNFNMIINGLRTGVEQIVESVKAGIGNLAATSGTEQQKKVFDKMNFIAFWTACVLCTCLFVLLNPFVGEIWLDAGYYLPQPVIAVLTVNFYIAIMVYPVETFRTANGLFIQGKYRPAIMAVLNILLDLVFVVRWGIIGVLAATTVSRLLTQVWYDPYLVYSRVFKQRVRQYLADYVIKLGITFACCAAALVLADRIYINNVLLRFILKGLLSFSIPNVVIFILYRRTEEFLSLVHFIQSKVKRFV